jgi:hypothetical protein
MDDSFSLSFLIVVVLAILVLFYIVYREEEGYGRWRPCSDGAKGR